MRVALLGSPKREEIQRLAMRLEERDVEPLVLDTGADPAIRMGPERLEACGVDLTRCAAFYVADLGLLPSSPSPRASQRHLVLWTTLLARLARRARVVNPPHTWDLHGLKPFEALAYARSGLAVPRTTSTSDPHALLQLGPSASGRIEKGVVGGYGYTELFEPPADADAARARLAAGPLVVQQRILGENVRAFVVGGQVVGAAEVVPASGAEVDSRRETGRVRRVALPAEARDAALRAARRFELSFAAVDFMREEGTGRYVVLECNSAPFFVEFERLTGIAVSSALADHLSERAPKRAPQPAAGAAPR
jgi:ribosomal protein S6--L-glutamate ligase